MIPIAFSIGVFPVVPMLWHQFIDALKVSQVDPRIQHVWWTKLHSWCLGGPIGRYFIGIGLGLYVLREQRISDGQVDDSLFESPHSRTILVAFIGLTISLFSFVCEHLSWTKTSLKSFSSLWPSELPGSFSTALLPSKLSGHQSEKARWANPPAFSSVFQAQLIQYHLSYLSRRRSISTI